MIMPPEQNNPSPHVEFGPGHAADFEKLGIFEKDQRAIRLDVLIQSAKEKGQIDEVMSLVSQEIANGCSTHLVLAEFRFQDIEALLDNYHPENMDRIINDLQVALASYEKVKEQAPLLEQCSDLLREERAKDPTAPPVSSRLQYYYDAIPGNLEIVYRMINKQDNILDRILSKLDNLTS